MTVTGDMVHCFVNEANSFCVIAGCRFVFADPVAQLFVSMDSRQDSIAVLFIFCLSLGSSDLGFATKLLFS